MTLQASGPISFSEIANEFGYPSGKNLGAYRVSQNVGSLSNLPLDIGVPQSSTIKFSDFYSKKLNVVVDLHSIANNSTRLIARSKYNNSNVDVIGGFKSRPSRSENTRIIINVNKTIGSDKGGINNVALRTGSWDAQTALELEVGSSGQLYGAGGDGGVGGGNGATGGQGTSALGVEYPIIIKNRGYIQSGSGGGGGGGYSNRSGRRGRRFFNQRQRYNDTYGGGGGGGGAGFPFGSGANGGGNGASAGNGGGFTSGGSGGGGGGANAGSGGSGGSNGGNGSNGGGGETGSGGSAGSQGRAIIIFNNGSGTTITNLGSGSINGPTVYNTTPT